MDIKEKNDLQDILLECENSAKQGYDIAKDKLSILCGTLNRAKVRVRKTSDRLNKLNCYIPDVSKSLQSQLTDIETSFKTVEQEMINDIEEKKQKLSNFSITLFGRTMAGKSTLMEILTNGDGKSIGLGAQRTTRDIRKYTWENMEITDVPGIGAFDGEEDEIIAYKAAKSADLVLFLLTDDAPQVSEAESLGRILSLGKPIICIINVKASVSEEKNMKLMKRDIEKRFNRERLDDIKTQFLSYSKQLGQEWGEIPFVYVHLKAAFLSQKIENQEKAQLLYSISCIEYLKNTIIKQVKNRGKFYRIKAFVDLLSNPMVCTMDTLLNQSLINSMQGRVILEKKRKLERWSEVFQRDSVQEIESMIIYIKSTLNSEIASFAEEHFSDRNADKAWKKIIAEKKLDLKCQELLKKFESKCNEKIAEISREITNELKFTINFTSDKTLKMNSIIDGKRVWNWTSIILEGGLVIGAVIAKLFLPAIAGPLGWAAFGVGVIGFLGSYLFKSRDEKECEARKKLEKSLRDDINCICEEYKRQLNKNLQLLIDKRIKSIVSGLNDMNEAVFELADTQKDLAWHINYNYLQLNMKIVTEAIHMIGAAGIEYHLTAIGRIPGVSILIMLNDGKRFPVEQLHQLHSLMAERIGFVFYHEDKKILISRILGKQVDRNDISIEEKIGVAHITINKETPYLVNRVKLAQQLSEILIAKR